MMPIESTVFGANHWSEASFAAEFHNVVGRYYVMEHVAPDGTAHLIAYAGLWILVDEAHITTLAVHPAYHGQGLGGLLLAHLIERSAALSVRWLSLEVRASNDAARRLYERFGMHVEGVRPKYYQDNQESALIMTTPDLLTDTYRNSTLAPCRTWLKDRFSVWPEGFGQ